MVSFDQKASLSPPPINSLPSTLSPPSTPRNESPSPPSLSVSPPSPHPSSPPPSPHSATWAVFRSLGSQVATVQLASQCLEGPNTGSRQATDDVMPAGSNTGPLRNGLTACNNRADRNPMQAAVVSIGSHPYGEKKKPSAFYCPCVIISP